MCIANRFTRDENGLFSLLSFFFIFYFFFFFPFQLYKKLKFCLRDGFKLVG